MGLEDVDINPRVVFSSPKRGATRAMTIDDTKYGTPSFVETEQKWTQERKENDRQVTAGAEESCKLQSVISDRERSSGEDQAEMQEQISTARTDLEQATIPTRNPSGRRG